MHHSELAGLSDSGVENDPGLKTAVRLFDTAQMEYIRMLGERCEELDEKSSWTLLYKMQGRATGHVAACLVLASNGHFAAAEALSRTAMESALNLYYCSFGDTTAKLITYFKDHIITERKQNRTWGESVTNSSYGKEAKAVHADAISGKEKVLAVYERVLDETFQRIGYSYSQSNEPWPSVFDRFRLIGKEIDYRTFYAALCSQAHNDPEDLLNDFVLASMQVEGSRERQRKENESFARFMVINALKFWIEASAMHLAKYFDGVAQPFKALIQEARQAAEDGVSHSQMRAR